MTDNIDISIIIPALNEEAVISDCLDAVLSQKDDYKKEIIIADYHSTDRTLEICKNYPVKITDGGHPAMARNNGAKIAAGEYYLFLDADTLLPANFLSSALPLFKNSDLAIASFFLKPNPGTFVMNIIFALYNYYGWLASWLSLPVFLTAGCCLLVRKSVHEQAGCFDENMTVLEEYEYIRKIKTSGRFRVLPLKVMTSTRRFGKGNGLKKTMILFYYYFKWLTGRKIPRDDYGYWTR